MPADVKKVRKKTVKAKTAKAKTVKAKTAKAKTVKATAVKATAVKAKTVDSSRDQSETIRIRLVRSVIGSSPRQRAVVAGLGLRRLNQVVERVNTREIRGMVDKVPHLVQIIS
jgi:large subunit ribosomal protein L30